MTINKRFELLINELFNGNKRAFAKAMGISPTVVENVVGTRQGKPSYDVLEKIYSNANISAHWLLTGEGSMLCSDSSGTISGDISNSAVSTAGPAINTVGQHSVELQTENHHLQQRITDLERLLDEKERLISILLSKQ